MAGGGVSERAARAARRAQRSVQRFRRYITDEGKKNAKNYKYKGSDLSLLYKYALSPLAQFCVDHFTPVTAAPNTITLAGLFLSIIAFYWTGSYAPHFELVEFPPWVLVTCGLFLFAYQTLDNMDGKQARKTGSSSALGLLFDHGCDAFNASLFGTLAFATCFGFGLESMDLLLVWTSGTFAFYCASWEEYHLHDFVLPIMNGPSEGLVMAVLMYFWTAYAGSAWWHGTTGLVLPLVGEMLWKDCFVAFTVFSGAATALTQIVTVVRHEAKGGRSVPLALARLAIPALTVAALWGMWAFEHEVLVEWPRVVFTTLTCSFVDACSKLMVSHVCGQTLKQFWPGVFLVLLVPGHAMLRALTGVELWAAEYTVPILFGTTALNVAALSYFIYYAVNELAAALGIYVFVLGKRTDKTE